MPDREVTTIRHLIHYQYAKIVAKSAIGEDHKKTGYGFVKSIFRSFMASEKTWSDIIREDKQLIQSEKMCVYCGATENLSMDHIIPKSLKIKPECSKCGVIHEIHNLIWACNSCNSSKGTKGLYRYYRDKHRNDAKFYDKIPKLLEKKFLKNIFLCHQCNGTLDSGDIDGDGKLTVLDIDALIK